MWNNSQNSILNYQNWNDRTTRINQIKKLFFFLLTNNILSNLLGKSILK